VPLPFNVGSELCCQALCYNKGLYTQCQTAREGEEEYCRSCGEEGAKWGTVEERKSVGLYEYEGKCGRKPISYLKVLEKLKITVEEAQAEAEKQGVTIAEEHLIVPEVKAKGKKGEKSSRGRPKKEMTAVEAEEVVDLFAQISADPEPMKNEVVEKAVEKEVVAKSKKLSEEERAAKKAALEAEKAQAKAEKEAQLAAAKAAAKAEKEAQLAAAKAEKEAQLAAAKAEKEAQLAAAKAEKEAAAKAKKDAEKAEKEAQLAAAKAEKEAQAKAQAQAKKESEKATKKPKKEAEKAQAKAEKEVESASKAVEQSVVASKAVDQAVVASKAVDEEAKPTKVTVTRIKIDGVEYMKSSANILYDPKTKEEVGLWDPVEQKIKELPEDEEEEDEYEDEEA
jgi:colicin import membrane protein